jgi:tetratricopeptide (TPR) repeat protein
VAGLQNASMMANINRDKAVAKAKRTDSLQNELDTYGWGDALGFIGASTAAGAIVGAALNNDNRFDRAESALEKSLELNDEQFEALVNTKSFEDLDASLNLTSQEFSAFKEMMNSDLEVIREHREEYQQILKLE